MKTIKLTIAGVTPLMMHNDRLANPMNEYARQLKEYTSKRAKTDEDYEAIAQIEFLGGIYYSEASGVHIPARNVRKCIEEGAKLQKKGTAIKRGVFVVEDELSLIYQGPKTPKELYRAGTFVDTRTAGNQGSRIVRTRPIFAPPWGFVATLMYEPAQINEADLRQAIEQAGMFCGLGDYRPIPSGGSFGKFRIEKWEA
jgi:hypothetical protein